MKIWKWLLPNLTIALNLAVLIVLYLDSRNPMMGFLAGAPFYALAACCCVCSIASAALLYSRFCGKSTASADTDAESAEKLQDNT